MEFKIIDDMEIPDTQYGFERLDVGQGFIIPKDYAGWRGNSNKSGTFISLAATEAHCYGAIRDKKFKTRKQPNGDVWIKRIK